MHILSAFAIITTLIRYKIPTAAPSNLVGMTDKIYTVWFFRRWDGNIWSTTLTRRNPKLSMEERATTKYCTLATLLWVTSVLRAETHYWDPITTGFGKIPTHLSHRGARDNTYAWIASRSHKCSLSTWRYQCPIFLLCCQPGEDF